MLLSLFEFSNGFFKLFLTEVFTRMSTCGQDIIIAARVGDVRLLKKLTSNRKNLLITDKQVFMLK